MGTAGVRMKADLISDRTFDMTLIGRPQTPCPYVMLYYRAIELASGSLQGVDP